MRIFRIFTFRATGTVATLLALSAVPAPPARAITVLRSGLINEGAPYPECHASTIAETAPGRLVAAWFGGTKERHPDVGIWVAQHIEGCWQHCASTCASRRKNH